MNKFGAYIRSKRTEHNLLLKDIAERMQIDIAILSKVERGERMAKRVHVLSLIQILDLNMDETIALWLADKVYVVLKDEDQGLDALKVAENEIICQTKKTKS